jgi:hypothetical protein
MKSKIIIALILLILGLTRVIDWVIFSTKKENESLSWEAFKIKYIEHLPVFLQPLYQKPIIITLILLVCFTIAGLLFIKVKKRIYFILGIISFVLAFWQLFSLM